MTLTTIEIVITFAMPFICLWAGIFIGREFGSFNVFIEEVLLTILSVDKERNKEEKRTRAMSDKLGRSTIELKKLERIAQEKRS